MEYLLLVGTALVCAYWLSTTAMALARQRSARSGRGLETGCAELRVGVVIPAFNEQEKLPATIAALRRSSIVPDSLVIVNDGSVDDTSRIARDLVRELRRAEVLDLPTNRGKARALNAGLRRVDADVVFTLDADTCVETQTIALAVATLARDGADAVACNVRVGNTAGWLGGIQAAEYTTMLNLDRRAQAWVGAITTVPGAAAAWRRTALAELGGFSGRTLAEDTDLTLTALRHGCRIRFADAAVARTHAPPRVRGLLAQRERWFWGNAACAVHHLRDLHRMAWRPRKLWVLVVFTLFNVGSVPFLAAMVWLGIGMLARSEVSFVSGVSVGLLLLGLCRCEIGYRLDGGPRQSLPRTLGALVLMPFVTSAAAAIGLCRRVRGREVGWNRWR